MSERLDLESERRADGPDVLAVELLEDRRLARVVEPPCQSRRASVVVVRVESSRARSGLHRKRMRISFSLKRFLRMIVRRPMGAKGSRVVASASSWSKGRLASVGSCPSLSREAIHTILIIHSDQGERRHLERLGRVRKGESKKGMAGGNESGRAIREEKRKRSREMMPMGSVCECRRCLLS